MEGVPDEAMSVDIITNHESSDRGSVHSLPSRQTSRTSSPNFKRWRWIIGLTGSSCYETFSLFVTTPDVIHNILRSSKLFSFLSNSLWASAHVGLCSYTFCSNLMRHFPLPQRLLFSVTGGVMFNFGSVLLWAILKKLSHSEFLRAMSAFLSGLVLLYVGSSFLSFREYDDDDIPLSSSGGIGRR